MRTPNANDMHLSKSKLFKFGYSWGRTLTIRGFDPLEDRLDLTSFWAEANSTVLGSSNGADKNHPQG
ncbi:MAG: hypothetical protein MJA27_23290 [Pseudanabaenales cyanobacterium]|nr:hypothetical protein [Pseudanabaenales cyanobacterium]